MKNAGEGEEKSYEHVYCKNDRKAFYFRNIRENMCFQTKIQ